MQKYEFLEHTADLSFKAYGRDLNELFENVAEAVEKHNDRSRRSGNRGDLTIEMESDCYEDSLYDWVSKLLTFEAGRFAVKKCLVKITGLSLIADSLGQRLDLTRHRLNAEVKAVIYHNQEVTKNDIYRSEETPDVWGVR